MFGGSLDNSVPLEDLEAWRHFFVSHSATKIFQGDHFFIESQRLVVLAEINTIIANTLDNY